MPERGGDGMQDRQDIERHQTATRWSQIVVHGGTIYLCGQVAQRARGGTVTEQTRDILARVEELLEEAGSSKARLLSVTIWLAEIGMIEEMNAVWDAWVPVGTAPARACVQARLGAPHFSVEMSVIAAR